MKYAKKYLDHFKIIENVQALKMTVSYEYLYSFTIYCL